MSSPVNGLTGDAMRHFVARPGRHEIVHSPYCGDTDSRGRGCRIIRQPSTSPRHKRDRGGHGTGRVVDGSDYRASLTAVVAGCQCLALSLSTEESIASQDAVVDALGW